MLATFTFAPAPASRIEINAAGELPKRIKVLNWGETVGANGRYVLNETSAALLPANQKATAHTRVAIDFEHNSVKTSPTYKGEPVSVGGHGDVELVVGDGLYVNNCDYTAKGREHIGGGDYPDVSPTLATNAKREVIFLHSVGAVRNGAIEGLNFSTNSAASLETLFSNLTTNSTMLDVKSLLCKILSIPADSADEAIQAAADTMTKEEAAEPAGSEPQMNAANLAIAKLTATVEDLTKKFGSMETNSATAERAQLVGQAAREGKVIPASALTGDLQLNNAQLSALIKDLPATVPLEQRTAEVSTATAATLQTNSAEDAVRKQLGFTAEEWAKLGKAA